MFKIFFFPNSKTLPNCCLSKRTLKVDDDYKQQNDKGKTIITTIKRVRE
jgi:hypothetical protein